MDCTKDPFTLPPELPRVVPTSDAGGPDLQEAIRDVERQLGVMIINARRSILKRAAAIHPDLQPMGFKVLTLLSQSGPIQQIALAHKMDADKAAMSRSIKQLEELGLVIRTPDPSDGRAHLVAMTDQGRASFDHNQSSSRQLLYDRLATWELSEVRRFADLLERLGERLD